MIRPASRLIARTSSLCAVPRVATPTRRFVSTAPPAQQSRSWKSLAARLGLAGGVIYYYNTTDVFAEEPRHPIQSLPETEHESEQLPTIEALAQERQQRKAEAAAAQEKEAANSKESSSTGGIEGLEEEADQQGAFNPETGEINWDCPCLGGMAHGPCGEEFKAAFSCFVFSTEDPKGMDCIDKFKGMQNCFREYPEIYGTELETDEEDDVTADERDRALPEPYSESQSTATKEKATPQLSPQPSSTGQGLEKARNSNADLGLVPQSYQSDVSTERAKAAKEQVEKEHGSVSESERIIPKAAHDESAANEKR